MNFNATLFGQLLAFLFFVWFCMKYVWPPMLAALEEREKEIADGLDATDSAMRDVGAVSYTHLTLLTIYSV